MTYRSSIEIQNNINIHNRIARKYESIHGEIFNPAEQARLHSALSRALDFVDTPHRPLTALDVGCGSGNLTGHLLDLGTTVIAADVSQGFLDLVQNRYSGKAIRTLQLNGRDLSNVPSYSCDVVAAYSVLHHIPDYLSAVTEMARVCSPGGVVFLDHEPNEQYWSNQPIYAEFKTKATRLDLRKYLTPANYLARIRRLFNPRYSQEGDIHVWPDDHIEWNHIDSTLQRAGLHLIYSEDYLLARSSYRSHVYKHYANLCSDMRFRIYRRPID